MKRRKLGRKGSSNKIFLNCKPTRGHRRHTPRLYPPGTPDSRNRFAGPPHRPAAAERTLCWCRVHSSRMRQRSRRLNIRPPALAPPGLRAKACASWCMVAIWHLQNILTFLNFLSLLVRAWAKSKHICLSLSHTRRNIPAFKKVIPTCEVVFSELSAPCTLL